MRIELVGSQALQFRTGSHIAFLYSLIEFLPLNTCDTLSGIAEQLIKCRCFIQYSLCKVLPHLEQKQNEKTNQLSMPQKFYIKSSPNLINVKSVSKKKKLSRVAEYLSCYVHYNAT